MGEDLENYEITPEDLGCMGEKEIDGGVVEEAVASGEPKQPINPCFEHIPFEKRKMFRKLYDTFEKKDMSFEDFCVEMCAVTSQGLMQQDLSQIISDKQMGNTRMAANKHAINRSMN